VLAGADVIETSTVKLTSVETPPLALIMLAAVRDFEHNTTPGRCAADRPQRRP
jgi:hypothetical protein